MESKSPADVRKFWDPLSSVITEDIIDKCRQSGEKLDRKILYYQEHPGRITHNLAGLFLLTLVCWLGLYRAAANESGEILQLGFLALLPPAVYYFQIKALEKRLVESLLAEQQGWLYDPNPSHVRWEFLAEKYPEIFRKGNREQSVGSQFWGRFEGESAFYSAHFRYTTGHGKSSRTLTETVYAFRLPQRAAHDFTLRPQNLLRRIENGLELGLTTEANDFNGLFHIDFQGEVSEVGADVLQVLSPDAQEKLIEFRRAAGDFDLLFRDRALLVSFRGSSQLRYTNFFAQLAPDPRDVEQVRQRMTAIVSLADAILPCLD